MTWTVNLGGHDDMTPDAKAAFEGHLLESVQSFIDDLKQEEGVIVTTAYVTTNTTGQVDLLAGDSEEEPDEADAADEEEAQEEE